MTNWRERQLTRREIVATTLAGIAAAGLPDWYANAANASVRAESDALPATYGANNQLNVAGIGMGGSKGGYRRGLDMTTWASQKPGVKIVAVCDIDQKHLEEAASRFGPDCAKYHDFREVLKRKDIDAVVIGTPDHWHAIVASAALRAGKHVYCEKPLTLTIDEGKQLVRVAHNSKKIFQVGSQQRSDAKFRMACELVRNGRIGKLQNVKANLPTAPKGGPFMPEPVPADLDWKMWLGPAPEADYLFNRTHGNFRWWLDYSGGMMTDWGAHHNDIAQWGMGMDGSGPLSVEAVGQGGIIGTNCYDVFPDFNVTYKYPNEMTLTTSNKGENGVEFIGDAGSIFVSRGVIRASNEKLLTDPLPANAVKLYESNDHMDNFINGVRTNTPTICPAEVGHRSVTVCHLANISLRLGGRHLDWDAKREEFTNSKEANAMLKRQMRGGWRV